MVLLITPKITTNTYTVLLLIAQVHY